MENKPSSIQASPMEFNNIHRKLKPPKVFHVIKREVKPNDLKLFSKKSLKKILPQPKPQTQPRQINFSFAKVLPFTALCVIFVLLAHLMLYGVKAQKTSKEILGVATSAYSELDAASQNLKDYQFDSALSLFDQASNNLTSAQIALNQLQALQFLPQAQSATRILNGAASLSLAGQKLSQGLSVFSNLKVNAQGVLDENFNSKLKENLNLLKESEQLLDSALKSFEGSNNLPPQYATIVSQAIGQVGELKQIISTFVELEETYLSIFTQEPKTYLLVFENYDELRATGGFIGTYGILKTQNGKINDLKIESVYNLDGRINDLIQAPLPMQPGIAKWRMRDANWFVDFPQSAQKLLYFFEKGSGTADGVIAVTPQLFSQLLTLVGPIEMPQYNTTLTAENFQEVVQFKTSVDYDPQKNEPKKLLADFSLILLNRLVDLNQAQWFDLFQIILNNLNQKQILIYSKDFSTQEIVKRAGFDGRIRETPYDYLSIYNTNLSGTKTDLKIEQGVQFKSKLLSDNSIVNSLTISRKNTAESLNRDFIRILVPLGSKLISATGFTQENFEPSKIKDLVKDPDLNTWEQSLVKQGDIWVGTEAGKTEFAGWITTLPGKNNHVTVVYTLPEIEMYGLLLQKQPGSIQTNFQGTFETKKKIHWHSTNVNTNSTGTAFTSQLTTDDFFGFVME